MMNPHEMLTFFEEQAKGFEMGASQPEGGMSALHLAEAFKAWFMQGIIAWRHSLDDPRPALQRAITVALKAIDASPRLVPPVPLWRLFDTTPAAYASLLVGCTRVDDLLGAACAFEGWKTDRLAHVGQALDRGVLGVVRGGSVPTDWDSSLQDIGGRRRLRLLAATYHNYMELVSTARAGNVEASLSAALRGGQLFESRSRDPFYRDAQLEGGGPDNPDVVDFRLAAIVKTLIPDLVSELQMRGCPHVWLWQDDLSN